MSYQLKPKEKAKDLLQKMERAINENTIGGITIEAKLAAKVLVNELIQEHNHKNQIRWNVTQTKFWEAVLSEITNYNTD